MKKISFYLTILTLAAAGPAFAEALTGTITDIDRSGGKVTMLRAGSTEPISVSFRNRASLANLSSGSSISLDAMDRGNGNWEARSLSAGSSAVETSPTSISPSLTSVPAVGGNTGALNSVPAGVNTNAPVSGSLTSDANIASSGVSATGGMTSSNGSSANGATAGSASTGL